MIQKYPYYTRSTSTITKSTRANAELGFLNEEIGDLIYCIGKNSHVNDKKGENLILSARCFKIANIGFVIFTVFITISAFFIEDNPQSIRIENLQDIQIQKKSKTMFHDIEMKSKQLKECKTIQNKKSDSIQSKIK